MDAGILATAAGTYAATNLDDFVVLTALFALDRATGARNTVRIWAGQIIGIGLLTAAAFLAAKVLNDVPTSWIRYLSLIPIVIGLKSLRRRDRQPRAERPRTDAGSTLAVVGITVANGGDNMALYIPLFHGVDEAAGVVTAACFLAMTLLWCTTACLLTRAAPGPGTARRMPAGLAPVAYIAIGATALIRSSLT